MGLPPRGLTMGKSALITKIVALSASSKSPPPSFGGQSLTCREAGVTWQRGALGPRPPENVYPPANIDSKALADAFNSSAFTSLSRIRVLTGLHRWGTPYTLLPRSVQPTPSAAINESEDLKILIVD